MKYTGEIDQYGRWVDPKKNSSHTGAGWIKKNSSNTGVPEKYG
jgi:hypothetical protein